MRSDTQANIAYDFDAGAPDARNPAGGASLSGHERNHLFLNLDGSGFVDVSGASGLDHPSDGRAFAILDYDRDGWSDIAIVSANAPLLQLYRNGIGDIVGQKEGAGGFVAVRLVGGNRTNAADGGWSTRDGYGAMVTLELGDVTLAREHRAGEGLAAQNSATMLVGIGPRDRVSSLTVRWPSGRIQEVPDVEAGTLVTIYEAREHSPDERGYEFRPYASAEGRPVIRSTGLTSMPDAPEWPTVREAANADAELVMYSTYATWCQACVDELPQLNHLREVFGRDALEMVGVPYDEAESPEKRRRWLSRYLPPYDAIDRLDATRVRAVQGFVKEVFKLDGIPASIITTRDGRVVLAKWGPPTSSEIHQLLEKLDPS